MILVLDPLSLSHLMCGYSIYPGVADLVCVDGQEDLLVQCGQDLVHKVVERGGHDLRARKLELRPA